MRFAAAEIWSEKAEERWKSGEKESIEDKAKGTDKEHSVKP